MLLPRRLRWLNRSSRPNELGAHKCARPGLNRLHLENLEIRCLPSTFIVLNTNDSGDGSFRKAILGTLTRRARGLISLDDVLRAAGPEGRSFAGVHEIPLERVIGSASAPAKAGDFDPTFLPIDRRLRDRWTRIYRAMTEGGVKNRPKMLGEITDEKNDQKCQHQ